ncbi:MAG: caspase family protein [Anaerolineae bacterium]
MGLLGEAQGGVVPFRRSVAVVVGIDTYGDGIATLRTAVNDARALAAVLAERHGYEVITLLNGEATRAGILDRLRALCAEANAPDRLLFYYAGHGVAEDGLEGPEGYLVPADAELGKVETYLAMMDLHRTLAAFTSRHALLILDCCFAGTARWNSTRFIPKSPPPMSRQRYERFIREDAWQIIVSAGDDELAQDSSFAAARLRRDGATAHGDQSPFGAALVGVLHGDVGRSEATRAMAADGIIAATELYLMLRYALGDVEGAGGRRQTPGIWPFSLRKQQKGEYVFLLVPESELRLQDAEALTMELNPWRGLQSYGFAPADAGLFYGRTEEIAQLRTVVECHGLTQVLGVSGSGKSSLVMAGLVAQLAGRGPLAPGATGGPTSEWSAPAPMRPKATPLAALRDMLTKPEEHLGWPGLQLPSLAAGASGAAMASGVLEAVVSWLRDHPAAKLLLVVDQFEELITQCSDAEERSAFADLLMKLIAGGSGRVHVVLTLRSDFETQLLERLDGTALAGSWVRDGAVHGKAVADAGQADLAPTAGGPKVAAARFVVNTMGPRGLREIIEGPATERALYFEPPDLVDDMVEAVSGAPGTLPQLSYVLAALYRAYIQSDALDRALTRAAYDDLGGVLGALQKRAEAAYEELPEAKDRDTLRRMLLRMVATGGESLTRRAVAYVAGEPAGAEDRAAAYSELRYDDDAENERVDAIYDRWTSADLRLLVPTPGDSRSQTLVEPAHDALIRGWARLVSWVAEVDRGDRSAVPLASQRELTEAVRRWHLEDKNARYGLLWHDNPQLGPMEGELRTAHGLPREGRRLRRWWDYVWHLRKPRNSLLPTWLNRLETEFVRRSLGRKAVRTGLSIGAITGMVVLTAAAVWQWRAAVRQSHAATIRGIWGQLTGQPGDRQLLLAAQNGLLDAEWADVDAWQAQHGLLRTVQAQTDQGIILNPNHTEVSGHSSSVESVAFSPDGKTLAAGSEGTIILWDVASRSPIGQPLAGHSDYVLSVAFSPDGKTLASGSRDNTIILWDVASWSPIGQPLDGHSSYVTSVAFSPDGKTLASGSYDKRIILWDVASRSPIGQPLDGHSDAVLSVAFSPDGKTLASGSGDETIMLWDVTSRSPIGQPMDGHSDAVYSVAFSPDGTTLASGSWGGTIILWDVASRSPIGQPLDDHSERVNSVAFSPDGKTLASGLWSTIVLWNVASRSPIGHPLAGHGGHVNVAFSPDGKTLASGSGGDTIILWDVASRSPMGQPLAGGSSSVATVAFSPDGKMLSSGSADGTIILWDVASRSANGQPLVGHSDSVSSVAFSPDGKTLASGSGDKSIILWNVASRSPIGQPLAGHSDSVYSVAFSPDGKTLASGSHDKTIILWDVASRSPIGEPLAGHSAYVSSVAFSPDGKTLASGSGDNTIILWDVASRSPIGEPLAGHSDSVYSVAFSPDGKTLASGSWGGTIILWDVASRSSIGQPLAGHSDIVYSVAFSPDGKTLASGSEDNTIILWDVASRSAIGDPLAGQSKTVYSVAFSPNGKTLASGYGDATIILWDVDPASWIERACHIANRNLTMAEWTQFIGDLPYECTCPDTPAGVGAPWPASRCKNAPPSPTPSNTPVPTDEPSATDGPSATILPAHLRRPPSARVSPTPATP